MPAIAVLSLLLILLVLVDGFEVMVLPRRVNRRWRPTRLFYRWSWKPWSAIARRMKTSRRRETVLSIFGPLSTIVLLSIWAAGLIGGFALLEWSLGLRLNSSDSLFTHLYLSGVTFFTLGFGDVTPQDPLGKGLAVAEAGIGFGFLAVVIGYLPVLYQSFSRREVSISMLDARAGSPPSAAQLLFRMARAENLAALERFLEGWERWAAELLESHISFPMLSYYRSQHDNQSWLAALTSIEDTCAILIAAVDGPHLYQARITFAAARHAVVDLALIFNTPPRPADEDRLPPHRWAALQDQLRQAGLPIRDGPGVEQKLTELRQMYEPFASALARHFVFTLPPILPQEAAADNWQTSAWMRRAPGLEKLARGPGGDEHFD
jgi:hypothetical protein